jgi:hypothetical protein
MASHPAICAGVGVLNVLLNQAAVAGEK